MDTKGARTNLALKPTTDEESSFIITRLPKPDPAKKQYQSELEVYIHSLERGQSIGIYIHPTMVKIKNVLYQAERQANHTFAATVEQLRLIVENSLGSAGLNKFLSGEKVCGGDLAKLGVYHYLLPRKYEERVREALYPYWV